MLTKIELLPNGKLFIIFTLNQEDYPFTVSPQELFSKLALAYQGINNENLRDS